MKFQHVLSAGLALFVIGLIAPTAQAAPVVGPPGTAGSEVAGGLVEKVHGRYRYRYHRSYDEDSCYDSCGHTYNWDDSYGYGYGYDRPSYRRRYRSLDYYYYPIPPYRNERWWFREPNGP